MSFIINQTKGVMSNALQRFSKELNVPITDVTLIIYTNDDNECTPSYRLFKKENDKNVFVKDLTFDEILNVKLDFLGREQIASPFLAQTINRMAEENKSDCKEIELMIRTYENTNNEPFVLLLSKNVFIKRLSFEEDIFQGI